MRLYLIRHGETDWNKEGRLQGRRDIPMNDRGIAQSDRIGVRLREMGLCAGPTEAADCLIVTSPLKRAKMCAEIIAQRLDYTAEKILTEPCFIERSFGLSEGEIWRPDMREHEQENQWESMEALVERAGAGIERYIKRREKNIIITAHGAVLKAALAVLSGEKIAYGDNSNAVKQGSIVVVEYGQDGLRGISEVDVLQDEQTEHAEEGDSYGNHTAAAENNTGE